MFSQRKLFFVESQTDFPTLPFTQNSSGQLMSYPVEGSYISGKETYIRHS